MFNVYILNLYILELEFCGFNGSHSRVYCGLHSFKSLDSSLFVNYRVGAQGQMNGPKKPKSNLFMTSPTYKLKSRICQF